MQQRSRIWRVPPCPWYDLEGMESWLSNMASRGWKLEKETFFLDIATFERAEPASVRYALEAAPESVSWTDDRADNPGAEAIKTHAEDGWEYVARRGKFYIYRREDAAEREVYRSRQAQAETLEKLAKRRRTYLIILAIMYCVLCPLARVWSGKSFVVDAANRGLCLVLLPFLIALLWVIKSAMGVVHLQKLARTLQNGGRPNRAKPWKERRLIFRRRRVLTLLLVAIWIVVAIYALHAKDSSEQPLSAYAGDPPFATIADFREGTYREDRVFLDSEFTQWHNGMVKTGIEWFESATVTQDDGSVLDGVLWVYYYEARSPWLAQAIASAYHRMDRLKAKDEYTPRECPDFGLDYAVAYRGPYHALWVVFREGNVVVRAHFSQSGHSSMRFEEWAGIIAESIR